MKISFYQQTVSDTEKQYTEKARDAGGARRPSGAPTGKSVCAAELRMGGEQQRNGIFGGGAEKGKSLIELQQEAENTDVAALQDYMTVMSNTMSEEDYAKMQEEGFDFSGMDPEEAVTIVDKIKAELVRSGKRVAGYTDDLDMETLAAALGSTVLAQAVAESFAQADIPLTEENLSALFRAWDMAEQLQPMEDGARRYLIDNEMEPEVWNLYLAENSGAEKNNGHAPKFYAEDVKGYFAETAGTEQANDSAGLRQQIDRVIEQSGREVNEENRQSAAWLLDRGLPLTEENLTRLEELKEIELPVSEEAFAQAASAAVAEGKSPVHAAVGKKAETIYEKAAAVADYYHGAEVWESTAGNITARRQLEEIRLRMTAEVNLKLIRSGFAIDTAPMEQLVEALKQAERELAESYFPEDAQAVEKYRLYRDTNTVAAEIPALPAEVLGSFAEGQSTATLESFHREGAALRDTYEKAQSSYETLMTEPRRDLGDSIKKAFANVDDILRDMEVELTDENRRAARILGYNRMEITAENLDAVRQADRQVKNVVEKLTPAATLKMIRDGVNPLEKSFEELEQYFDELPEEYKEASQSYSRFLYGLEKNKELTAEERESYIGIYRLMRQIEKTDGAAVGALVNAQAQLHFANLLSAVRTGKMKSLNVRADDTLGTVKDLTQKGESISGQIAKAFAAAAGRAVTEASYSEAAEKAYNQEELEMLRQTAAAADSECIAMLQRGEVPMNADNLMAAQALTTGRENLFGTPLGRAGGSGRRPWAAAGNRGDEVQKDVVTNVSSGSGEEDAVPEAGDVKAEGMREGTELWKLLKDREAFEEGYAAAAAAALRAVETATFTADSSLDVRQLQLIHKQLGLASALAKKEEYFLPFYAGDSLIRVHLTLNKTGEAKGTVSVAMTAEDETRVRAEFSLDNGTLSGILKAENQNEVMKLQKIADNFISEAKDSWEIGNLCVTTAEGGRQPQAASVHTKTENAELYRVARLFLQSMQ